jgi:hypothetical protein
MRYRSLFSRLGAFVLGALLLLAAPTHDASAQDDDADGGVVTAQQENPLEGTPPPLPDNELLRQALDAHGSYDTWIDYGTLEYDLERQLRDTEGEDHQVIDLLNRRVLIEGDEYTIGYTGDDAWITPAEDALDYAAPPRFYSQTYFYFFAIPFVFADPGINRETLGREMVAGRPYEALRITYQAGIGDSPEDEYIAYFDPETHELQMVRYSVTYGSINRPEPNAVIVYQEWQMAGGLKVPAEATFHPWEDGAPGPKIGEVSYDNVSFSEELPPRSMFEIPEGAVMDESLSESSSSR